MHESKSQKILIVIVTLAGFSLWWFLVGYFRFAGVEISISAKAVMALAVFTAMALLLFAVVRLGLDSSRRIIKKNWDLAGEKVELSESLAQLEETFYGTLKSIASAVDAHDDGHSFRVANYSVKIGKEMGLSNKELKILEEAALFHDIGKIWITPRLCYGNLTMAKESGGHPVLGAELLSAARAPQRVVAAVLHHHERFDGAGFPIRLKGGDIPLEARIIAVADAFDRLTTPNLRGEAKNIQEAVDQLLLGTGTAFDPLVVDAFLSALDEVVTAAAPESTWTDDIAPRMSRLTGNC